MASLIARLGQSPVFVAWMAHMWFAYAVIRFAAAHGMPLWAAVAWGLILAACKEFLFDIAEEHDPPQTVADGWTDFCGYASGIALAAVAILL